MSTRLAPVRCRAGLAALASQLPTQEAIPGGAVNAPRFLLTAAVEEGLPAHALAAARHECLSSPGEAGFAGWVCSAMRTASGRPAEKPGVP